MTRAITEPSGYCNLDRPRSGQICSGLSGLGDSLRGADIDRNAETGRNMTEAIGSGGFDHFWAQKGCLDAFWYPEDDEPRPEINKNTDLSPLRSSLSRYYPCDTPQKMPFYSIDGSENVEPNTRLPLFMPKSHQNGGKCIEIEEQSSPRPNDAGISPGLPSLFGSNRLQLVKTVSIQRRSPHRSQKSLKLGEQVLTSDSSRSGLRNLARPLKRLKSSESDPHHDFENGFYNKSASSVSEQSLPDSLDKSNRHERVRTTNDFGYGFGEPLSNFERSTGLAMNLPVSEVSGTLPGDDRSRSEVTGLGSQVEAEFDCSFRRFGAEGYAGFDNPMASSGKINFSGCESPNQENEKSEDATENFLKMLGDDIHDQKAHGRCDTDWTSHGPGYIFNYANRMVGAGRGNTCEMMPGSLHDSETVNSMMPWQEREQPGGDPPTRTTRRSLSKGREHGTRDHENVDTSISGNMDCSQLRGPAQEDSERSKIDRRKKKKKKRRLKKMKEDGGKEEDSADADNVKSTICASGAPELVDSRSQQGGHSGASHKVKRKRGIKNGKKRKYSKKKKTGKTPKKKARIRNKHMQRIAAQQLKKGSKKDASDSSERVVDCKDAEQAGKAKSKPAPTDWPKSQRKDSINLPIQQEPKSGIVGLIQTSFQNNRHNEAKCSHIFSEIDGLREEAKIVKRKRGRPRKNNPLRASLLKSKFLRLSAQKNAKSKKICKQKCKNSSIETIKKKISRPVQPIAIEPNSNPGSGAKTRKSSQTMIARAEDARGPVWDSSGLDGNKSLVFEILRASFTRMEIQSQTQADFLNSEREEARVLRIVMLKKFKLSCVVCVQPLQIRNEKRRSEEINKFLVKRCMKFLIKKTKDQLAWVFKLSERPLDPRIALKSAESTVALGQGSSPNLVTSVMTGQIGLHGVGLAAPEDRERPAPQGEPPKPGHAPDLQNLSIEKQPIACENLKIKMEHEDITILNLEVPTNEGDLTKPKSPGESEQPRNEDPLSSHAPIVAQISHSTASMGQSLQFLQLASKTIDANVVRVLAISKNYISHHLNKHVGPRKKSKIAPNVKLLSELLFYLKYFGQTSHKDQVPLELYYLPKTCLAKLVNFERGAGGPKSFKTINTKYIRLILGSRRFLDSMCRFLQNELESEYQKMRIEKLHFMARNIDNFKYIDSVKLPWTSFEISQATASFMDIIRKNLVLSSTPDCAPRGLVCDVKKSGPNEEEPIARVLGRSLRSAKRNWTDFLQKKKM